MSLNKIFLRFPFISQGIVSSVLEVTTDIVTQKFIEKKEKLDHKRVFVSMFMGYLGGLALRKWFGFLHETFRHPKPFANAVGKLTGEANRRLFLMIEFLLFQLSADQFLFMPLYLGTSTGILKYVETGSWRDTKVVLNQELVGIVIQDFQLWPAVQFLNFYRVPLKFQVPVTSFVSVAWKVFNKYRAQENVN